MKNICTILTIILFSFTAMAADTSTTTNAPKKFVILGDSLTEGYGVAQSAAFPALLQKKVDTDKLNWKVISSGSSGSTSASGLQRIKWIAKDKPDIVLVLLGSNDGLRGLKVEDTEKNLNDTIEWAKKNNITVALGQLHVPPNYGKDYEKKFSAVYAKVAAKNKIQLGPFLLDKVAGNKDLNLADGIHPNEKGHQIVADNLYPFVKKLLGK
ncbi:arylesterase [Pseudobdellovibrio sp. HCB154]|uniref:arylesterase n=1 Tax=Pseudobdellovibrio sp. HCB154 TaxID=3386277 RepID=UPI0039171F91